MDQQSSSGQKRLSEEEEKTVAVASPTPPTITRIKSPDNDHGNRFQSKLLFLLLIRAIIFGYKFHLGRELEKFGGKFDDLIFLKDYGQSNQSFLYLQAKHRLYEKPHPKAKKITTADLLHDNKGDFSLIKYFQSFRDFVMKAKGGPKPEDKVDCVISTNVDFDMHDLVKNGIKLMKLSRDEFNDLPRELLAFQPFQRQPTNEEVKTGKEESWQNWEFHLSPSQKIPTYYRLKPIRWLEMHFVANVLRNCADNEREKLDRQSNEFKCYQTALLEEKVMIVSDRNGAMHPDFIDGVGLSREAETLRSIIVKLVPDRIWTKWTFRIDNILEFKAKQNVGVVYSLGDFITEIEDFFNRLIFAVNTPNEYELDHILKDEVAEYYKVPDSSLYFKSIFPEIENWYKYSSDVWLSSETGIKLLNDVKCEVNLPSITKASDDFGKQLKTLEFKKATLPDEVENELKCLLCSSSSEKMMHLSTPLPKLTASKVIKALETRLLQKNDLPKPNSYLIAPLTRQQNEEKIQLLVESFGYSGNSIRLFIIVCDDSDVSFKLEDRLGRLKTLIREQECKISEQKWIIISGDTGGTYIEANLNDLTEESRNTYLQNTSFKSRFLDEFEPKKMLGEGGFGVVFEVCKIGSDQGKYAVKRQKSKAVTAEEVRAEKERAEREAAVWNLDHPNLVRFYSAWWENPPPGWQEYQDKANPILNDETSSSTSSCPSSHHTSVTRNFSSNTYTSFQDQVTPSMFDEDYIETTFQTGNFSENPTGKPGKDQGFRSEMSSGRNPVYWYIQMELCREQSLSDWIRNGKQDPVLDVQRIFRQILSAVEYLHNKGLIHRDLKPSNIFFATDKNWTVKVGDFGLIKNIVMEEPSSDSAPNRALQDHTKAVGTYLYMSPELLANQGYNHKVDIYALAIIYFQLLVKFGTVFEEIKVIGEIKKTLTFPEEFVKEYGIEVEQLLKKMLSTERDERPEVKDIISELASIESRKKQTTTPTMCARSEKDTSFQWKLAMLSFIGGIVHTDRKFELGVNTSNSGATLDHLIYKYQKASLENVHWRYRYLHAKYQENSLTISTTDKLFNESGGDLSLPKFFRFYLDIIKRNEELDDLVMCTNSEFNTEDLTNHGIELELLSTPDEILGEQGKRYKIKCTSALEELLKADDDPSENKKIVNHFFEKLVFVVNMPSDSELDEIINDEVGQMFKANDGEIQSDFIFRKMVSDLTVPGRFLTSEDGKKMLKEAGQKMDLLSLRVLSNDYQKSLRKLHTKNTQEEIQLMSTKIEQHFSTTSSDINGNGMLRIKTIEPESTAVKVFDALLTQPDYKYQDSYLALPSTRLDDETEWIKETFEFGKFRLLIIVCVDGVAFQGIYQKLMTTNDPVKKKLIIVSQDDQEGDVTLIKWKEITDSSIKVDDTKNYRHTNRADRAGPSGIIHTGLEDRMANVEII